MRKETAIHFLYSALRAPLGIVVQTEDAFALRKHLYAARRKLADPSLEILSFVPSPADPKGELWIVKKERTDGEELAEAHPLPI